MESEWVPPLPENWQSRRYFHKESTFYYFINHKAKKSQWDDPRFFDEDKEGSRFYPNRPPLELIRLKNQPYYNPPIDGMKDMSCGTDSGPISQACETEDGRFSQACGADDLPISQTHGTENRPIAQTGGTVTRPIPQARGTENVIKVDGPISEACGSEDGLPSYDFLFGRPPTRQVPASTNQPAPRGQAPSAPPVSPINTGVQYFKNSSAPPKPRPPKYTSSNLNIAFEAYDICSDSDGCCD